MNTQAPRWVRTPGAGIASHHLPLPTDLADRLRRSSDALTRSSDALLMAAHARVLATLSGESTVVVGYAGADRADVEVHRLHVEATSWRALVADATLALGAGGTPGTDPTVVETAVVAPGHAGELPGDALSLSTALLLDAATPSLVLTYRAEELDADAAGRVAGYLITALTALTADPDERADHGSLTSGPERQYQLTELGGPQRPLPDRRVHQLFEDRVRRHPDRIAARCAGVELSYADLDRRVNRVANALLATDLGREDVVAVVTERNLEWLVSVLAIFKAGGAYLPIEPHFPAERVAATLRRAEAKLALTERASARAVPAGIRPLLVDEIVANSSWSDAAPGVEVAADQLAYIYFTSGSTGQPKGAMCEQAGMLNHLLAKIEDLGLDEGAVVAQIAPQCFDISLWQLVSGLLVGGTTVIVPQATILDVGQFLEVLRTERVQVLQVVPSYLEVVLTCLDRQPEALPDLRVVSVTGEAVKQELVERWFAARPGVSLINAYGLTETSDDTNHEVMHEAPAESRVPLGPPIRNVQLYVVDPDLQPVPLGAPGEIVFSGVCVGRGYINDPERTAAAFGPDPHRPGERLYRSGDFGRWRPDGKLEFLGRRDSQLKISGFRIEIGEIENTLLGVDGVRDAAVVVIEQPDGGKALVGFYGADAALDDGELRGRLRDLLPHYMVPPVVHWQASLPLSDNGKIDRSALAALAIELGPAASESTPGADHLDPYESRVARAWTIALKRPEATFGPDDHFFDQGGSSLSAVKVVIGLDRAVTLKDVTTHPVLADLARLLQPTEQAPGAKADSRVLVELGQSAADPGPILICLPPAAGNAVNFQPLAAELGTYGIRVLAVDPPGHDVGDTPFLALSALVDRVVQEWGDRPEPTGPVALYGHSAGAVAALALAWRLVADGHRLDQVVLGAQLPGTVPSRRSDSARLAERTDADLGEQVLALSGQAPADAEHTDRLGSAYRHDLSEANAFMVDALSGTHSNLQTPLTVVLAEDDAAHSSIDPAQTPWREVADEVRLVVLDGGGHYFLRTRPAALADVVADVMGAVPAHS